MLSGLIAGYEAVLVATGLLGLAAFAYISLLLYRLARLGLAGYEPVAGFALLAASHAWVLVMALAGPRLAYAAYTATSSFAVAGFMLLAPPGRREHAAAPVLLPLLLDMGAAAAALAASRRFSGAARTLVTVLGLFYGLRAAGVALLPSSVGAALLAVAELGRAASASMLAAYYASTTRGEVKRL